MAEASLADLYAQALSASPSGGTAVILPDGPYRVQLMAKKMSTSKQGGKPQMGLRWTVLDGPYAGYTVWTNQTLTHEGAALGIWLRQMVELGVDEALVRSGTVHAGSMPDYIVKGIIGEATFGNHAFGSDPATGQPKFHQDLKKFKLESVPAVSVTGTPAIPNLAAPNVAQPAVAIPTPQVPQVAVPVAAPVAVPQAAPVAPVAAPVAAPAPVAQPVPVVAVPPLPQAPVVPVAPTGTQVSF